MKKILAIPGSIRKNSYNKSVCKYLESLSSMEEFSQRDIKIKYFELDSIPMFNADLETDLPAPVMELIKEVEDADAVIFSTPEYNNMVPGVLKNACEWLSRSYARGAVSGKPVAIVGASDGGFGTVRAQNQLLLLASILGFGVDASLRLPISKADKVFADEGRLLDEKVAHKLQNIVKNLVAKI